MNPALLPQLPHGGVDPGVPGPPLSPSLEHAHIILPGQGQADGVVSAVIKVGDLREVGSHMKDSAHNSLRTDVQSL